MDIPVTDIAIVGSSVIAKEIISIFRILDRDGYIFDGSIIENSIRKRTVEYRHDTFLFGLVHAIVILKDSFPFTSEYIYTAH